MVAGPNGTLYAAWTEYHGLLWFTRSHDGGKTFSRPQRIAGGDGSAPVRAPALALGEEGRIYLAWTVGEEEEANIHLAASDDGGATFSQPVPVASSKGYADAPKLAIGPDGALHLAYAQSEAGPFASYGVYYTRSHDKGRSFAPARRISHPLPFSMESTCYPSLGVNAAGNVVIAYELYPDPRGGARGLGVSVSPPGEPDFSHAETVPNSASADGGTNGSHQGKLMNKLAVSRDGRIALVNSSLKQGVRSRVWLLLGEVATVQGQR